MEAPNLDSKNSFLTPNGQVGHVQSISDLVQPQVSMETLEKQIEEIDRELRKFDIPVSEDHDQSMENENTSPQYTSPQPKKSSPIPTFTPPLSKTLITQLNPTRIPTRPHHLSKLPKITLLFLY